MNNGKQPTTYTAEFRASAVKLALETDQPITQTARELGVNPNTLHTWIGIHRNKSGIPVKSEDDQHGEMKRLRKENKRLKEERDILKKAAAYFATAVR